MVFDSCPRLLSSISPIYKISLFFTSADCLSPDSTFLSCLHQFFKFPLNLNFHDHYVQGSTKVFLFFTSSDHLSPDSTFLSCLHQFFEFPLNLNFHDHYVQQFRETPLFQVQENLPIPILQVFSSRYYVNFHHLSGTFLLQFCVSLCVCFPF